MALAAGMHVAGLACQGCLEEHQARYDWDPASDAPGAKEILTAAKVRLREMIAGEGSQPDGGRHVVLGAKEVLTEDSMRHPQVREANQMVEEMMLLANVTVAEHVLSRFAGCALLRRHEVPPPRQFEPLLKAASAAGFSVDISSSKVCTTGSRDLFSRIVAVWDWSMLLGNGSGRAELSQTEHLVVKAPLVGMQVSPAGMCLCTFTGHIR